MVTQARKDTQTESLQLLLKQVQELREAQKALYELIAEPPLTALPKIPQRHVGDVPFGITFSRYNRQGKFFRVKPTSYLLNSSVVTDSLAAQKSMIVDVQQHTVYFVPNEELIPLD